MPTQDEWRALLDRRLPARTTYIARNRAISALYARWYLQEPWLFKWAGMAAIASAQVGVGIALAEMLDAPAGAVRATDSAGRELNLLDRFVEVYGRGLNLALFIPLNLHDAATRALLREDLTLIKQANDAIFHNIGWAHAAYASDGLGALEQAMDAQEDAPLLEAFRMLDEGAHRLCDPAGYQAGSALIQQSATAMLRHEQRVILPPYMEPLSNLGKVIASIGAALDFEGAPGLIGQPSFGGHFGPLAVLAGSRSVANTEDRWEWIERNVLPAWARLDAAYSDRCALHRQLAAIGSETPNLFQQTAGMMNVVYPALGLKLAF